MSNDVQVNAEESAVDQLWLKYLIESFRAKNDPDLIEKTKSDFREGLRQQIEQLKEVEDRENQHCDENQEVLHKEEQMIQDNVQKETELQAHIQEKEDEARAIDSETQELERRNCLARDELVKLQQRIADTKAKLNKSTAEKQDLQDQVQKLGISPRERAMMAGERTSLKQQFEQLDVTRQKLRKEVQEADSSVANICLGLQQMLKSYDRTIIGMSLDRNSDLSLHFEPGTTNE